MNAYLKMLTWILGVIAVFVLEITVINLISGETYLLLMYDLKNQFADNLIYAMSLVILAFVDTGGGTSSASYANGYLLIGSKRLTFKS